MLVLRMTPGMNVALTIPPSPTETRVVVTLEGQLEWARIGIMAPREVEILRSDAKLKQPAGK